MRISLFKLKYFHRCCLGNIKNSVFTKKSMYKGKYILVMTNKISKNSADYRHRDGSSKDESVYSFKTGVYLLTFPNGKIYIGSCSDSKGFYNRWRKGKGYKAQAVTDAIKKYGWDNVKKEILEYCAPEHCLAYEQTYLDYFKPWTDTGKGYNVAKDVVPVSAVGKLSKIDGVKKYWKDNHHLRSKAIRSISIDAGIIVEYPSITSTKHHGFDPSCVHLCLRGLRNTHKGNRWKYIDSAHEPTIKEFSNSIPIVAINISTGEILHFPSIKATVTHGFKHQSVTRCLNGTRKTHHGHIFKYESTDLRDRYRI